MIFKYPHSVELKLEQNSFIVTSYAFTFIPSADLTISNSTHLKFFTVLTLQWLQPIKICDMISDANTDAFDCYFFKFTSNVTVLFLSY